MPRQILLDNDFVLKIAAIDLMDEFVALPFVREGDLRCLQSLPFMIRKGKFAKYTEEGLARALAWCSSLSQVEAPPPSAIDQIPLLPGIDQGERLLMGSVLVTPDSSIFTGDKRSVHALAGAPAALVDALRGKILCLEATIRAIVATSNFESIAIKVRPGLQCDSAIRACFGSARSASCDSVKEGLESYINDIQNAPGGCVLLPWQSLL